MRLFSNLTENFCKKRRDGREDCINETKVIDKKLVQWVIATSVLVTTCLSHIYAAPFLAYEPQRIPLNAYNISNVKVSFDNEFMHGP